jgi:hypothetical protein
LSVYYNAHFPELFQGFCTSGELVGFSITPIIYTQFGFEAIAVFFTALTVVTHLISIRLSWSDCNQEVQASSESYRAELIQLS